MEKPLPFVLENHDQIELNKEVLKIIEKSNYFMEQQDKEKVQL